MFHTDNIEAIDILQKKLPDELQDWHRWGNISELHYYKEIAGCTRKVCNKIIPFQC